MNFDNINIINIYGTSDINGTELLFGGDFCPLRNYGEKIHNGQKIFSPNLERLFGEHDFSMVNLEAPLCNDDTPTQSLMGAGIHCYPEVATMLNELGVDAVGLANNHILDYTDQGLLQTINALKQSGVKYSGAGKNLSTAEQPLEVICNGLKIGIWCLAEKELNCASKTTPGSSFFSPERNIPRIAQMRNDYDFLVIYVHAGHEFTFTPSPRIRASYRAFIDAGANLVIGHHPHVAQGVEQYGHGIIAYSLGNLVFDSDYVDGFPNTDLGYLVSVAIGKHEIKRLTLIPYRLTKQYVVAQLPKDEFENFSQWLNERSKALKDESLFWSDWEKDVLFRWNTYYGIMTNISNWLFEPNNLDYAVRTSNILTCPTHLEMYAEIIRMWKEGKLTREQPHI